MKSFEGSAADDDASSLACQNCQRSFLACNSLLHRGHPKGIPDFMSLLSEVTTHKSASGDLPNNVSLSYLALFKGRASLLPVQDTAAQDSR
jgi:hypothetical protein